MVQIARAHTDHPQSGHLKGQASLNLTLTGKKGDKLEVRVSVLVLFFLLFLLWVRVCLRCLAYKW